MRERFAVRSRGYRVAVALVSLLALLGFSTFAFATTLDSAAAQGDQSAQADDTQIETAQEVDTSSGGLETSNAQVRRALIGLIAVASLTALVGLAYWYFTGVEARRRFAAANPSLEGSRGGGWERTTTEPRGARERTTPRPAPAAEADAVVAPRGAAAGRPVPPRPPQRPVRPTAPRAPSRVRTAPEDQGGLFDDPQPLRSAGTASPDQSMWQEPRQAPRHAAGRGAQGSIASQERGRRAANNADMFDLEAAQPERMLGFSVDNEDLFDT